MPEQPNPLDWNLRFHQRGRLCPQQTSPVPRPKGPRPELPGDKSRIIKQLLSESYFLYSPSPSWRPAQSPSTPRPPEKNHNQYNQVKPQHPLLRQSRLSPLQRLQLQNRLSAGIEPLCEELTRETSGTASDSVKAETTIPRTLVTGTTELINMTCPHGQITEDTVAQTLHRLGYKTKKPKASTRTDIRSGPNAPTRRKHEPLTRYPIHADAYHRWSAK